MKTAKINSKERKNLTNVANQVLTSPYKVLKAINGSLDSYMQDGMTVAAFLGSHGVKGKLSFNDLFQIEGENGLQVARLEKYCKAMQGINPYKYGMNLFKVGNCWYKAVVVEFSIEMLIESLNAKIMLDNERSKSVDMYTRFFERIDAKKDKQQRSKEKSSRRKQVIERKKIVRSLIRSLQNTEVYAGSSFVAVAKEAFRRVNTLLAA